MAVLGYNTIGSSNVPSGRWLSCKFVATEPGLITDFAAYIASSGGAASFKFIIYNDNGGIPGSTILAQSANVSYSTTAGWFTDNISYTFADGEVLHFYIMSDDSIVFYYDSGDAGQTQESTEDSFSWPTVPTPPTNADPLGYPTVLSLYVNYTPLLEGVRPYIRKGIRPALFKPGNSR